MVKSAIKEFHLSINSEENFLRKCKHQKNFGNRGKIPRKFSENFFQRNLAREISYKKRKENPEREKRS